MIEDEDDRGGAILWPFIMFVAGAAGIIGFAIGVVTIR
jgi:hypothetical protein